MKLVLSRCAAWVLIFLLSSCAGGKGSAEQTIKAVEGAYDAVKEESLKYIPDQARAVESALSAAKQSFNQGDYAAALNLATELNSKVKDLSPAIAAKKDELTRSWTSMSAGLPKMLDAIKSRVDILSQSKKLPAGLDKVKFEGAKTGVDEISQTLSEATSAFSSGDLTDALAKAKAVKDKAVDIMTTLGMPIPPAARS